MWINDKWNGDLDKVKWMMRHSQVELLRKVILSSPMGVKPITFQNTSSIPIVEGHGFDNCWRSHKFIFLHNFTSSFILVILLLINYYWLNRFICVHDCKHSFFQNAPSYGKGRRIPFWGQWVLRIYLNGWVHTTVVSSLKYTSEWV